MLANCNIDSIHNHSYHIPKTSPPHIRIMGTVGTIPIPPVWGRGECGLLGNMYSVLSLVVVGILSKGMGTFVSIGITYP